MSGFWGAETDAVRQQGSACTGAAGTVESLLAACTALIDGVDWIGPDADAFRERWGGEVRPRIEQSIEELRADGEELSRHAEEQDEASGGGDGGTVLTPGIPSIPILPLPLPKAFPMPSPWGRPMVPTLPGRPIGVDPVPFPIPTLPKFEITDCPVPRIDRGDLRIGVPPIMTDCFPVPDPLPSIFPPRMTDCWPLPDYKPLPQPLPILQPLPDYRPLPQPLPILQPLPDYRPLPMPGPLPIPRPAPMPENWPLPQPLPQPLPIPDPWPMPLPMPRPDVYRI